jgi:hypothetical protein
MIDDLYVLARRRDLARQCAPIATERKVQAARAAAALDSAPRAHAAVPGPLSATATPLAQA